MSRKPEWLYQQSAVIPYRVTGQQVEILFITSIGRRRWIIPKGVIEPGLTPAASAAKEAWEEAGIRGQIAEQSIGSYEYHKWGGTCHVIVFLFEVQDIYDSWPEQSQRQRQWMPLQTAIETVEEPELKRLLKQVLSVSGINGNPKAS